MVGAARGEVEGTPRGKAGGKLDFKRAEMSSSHRTHLHCPYVAPETTRDIVGQWGAGRSEAARRCCALCINANASVNSGPGLETSVALR